MWFSLLLDLLLNLFRVSSETDLGASWLAALAVSQPLF